MMSEELQHTYKKQLELWIGTGPKQFLLLYSTSEENCYNAQTFHQKCDNQGPTVTVLYDTSNSIFGGYTSVNWDEFSYFVRDENAFLFQLHYNGKAQYNKFPVQESEYAIYCSVGYGPTFGANVGYGHDLHCFNGIGHINRLNGHLNPNNCFDCKGLQAFQINGHMNVYANLNVRKIEVYKVIDIPESPWRISVPWKQESFKQLIDCIENHEPPEALKLQDTQILMMGPIGAGKSSYVNTVNSIFKGRITQICGIGSAEHSLTTVYRQYKFRSSTTKNDMRFRLCDTRGMEETERLGLIEFNYLLEGNVPDWCKFEGATPISQENPLFIKNPGIQDKVHCVMFVFDSTTLDVIPMSIMERIKDMKEMLFQKGVPQTVILTKVDKLSTLVKDDVSKVYLCEVVKDEIDKVTELLGIPRSYIFPIKNYEHETELDQNINILALQALRQVLGFANDYLESYLARMKHANIAQINTKFQNISL